MTKYNQGNAQLAPSGYLLAPLQPARGGGPLGVCLLIAEDENLSAGPFVLLRELPGSRVYLGVVCDAEARIQEWVEIWVQTLELRDLSFSHYQEQLNNQTFDQRWKAEYENQKATLPESVFVTGMETRNPAPLLIKRQGAQAMPGLAPVEVTNWQICKDDALLETHGLPLYSSSPFRYLHDPASSGPKTFLATATDAPAGSHVQGIDRLGAAPELRAIFNVHAGLIRVTRFDPLSMEDYLQLLEGGAWTGMLPGKTVSLQKSNYSDLQAWSATRKGISFLLHETASLTDKLNEIFFLKLSLLRDMFKEVRSYVKAHQLPLLNLKPSNFNIGLPATGDQFPALWAAKCTLVKPGQAHPLKIKSTEQRYFVRLGRVEPSPFLPQGMGAHSFGIGNVRIRSVVPEADGTVIEGTLVAEDYLGLDAHDLLWFKLPVGAERVELYAHVYPSDIAGPKEARFRTVPTKLSESLLASLKQSSGSVFQKSPYEIWPLLSSPCDLYSLGIMAIRILLANSKSNLPVIIDEILSLARHLAKDPVEADQLLPKLKALVEHEPQLLDLVSPHLLIEGDLAPAHARSQLGMGLWLETMCVLLRLFPGTGAISYCKSFGDVSPKNSRQRHVKPDHWSVPRHHRFGSGHPVALARSIRAANPPFRPRQARPQSRRWRMFRSGRPGSPVRRRGHGGRLLHGRPEH